MPQPYIGTWLRATKSVDAVSTLGEIPTMAKSPSCWASFWTICRLVCGLLPSSWHAEKSIVRPPGSSLLLFARSKRALKPSSAPENACWVR